MPTRRSGDLNAFWNNTSVLANGVSSSVEVPRGIENLALWITVSAATDVSLEASHSGDVTSEGVLPDTNAANWALVYYVAEPIIVQFMVAGSACVLIPDFEPAYIRLRSSAAAIITAGWEVTSG